MVAEMGDEQGNQDELAVVESQITEASNQLQREAQHNAALGGLGQYVEELMQCVSNATDAANKGSARVARTSPPPSFGVAADTVVAMGPDESPVIYAADLPTAQPITNSRLVDIDELLDKVILMPEDCKPPTPPPRSRARAKSAPMPGGDSLTEASSMPLPQQSPWTPSLPLPLHERRMIHAMGDGREREDVSRSSPRSHRRLGHVPEIEASSGHFRRATESRLSSTFSISDNGNTADVHMQAPARQPHWQNHPHPTLGQQHRANDRHITDTATTPRQKATSSRFSSFMSRSLSLRRNRAGSTPTPRNADIATAIRDNKPATIFGCSLSASMEVARGLAPVTLPSGRTTTQAFPLCVLRCVYFIRSSSPRAMDSDQEQSGVSVPHIFGLGPRREQLSQLVSIFASPSTGYGRDIDWSPFNVHDAASLILHFMSSLPRPLVSEATIKRWVSMSRQATVSGTAGTRVEQGMDFWEEALLGIKGGRERGMVKLLLGLWGEIARYSEVNEMTAERLAGCMLGPLMGEVTARGSAATNSLLGLAFLIRRRAEEAGGMAGRDSGAMEQGF